MSVSIKPGVHALISTLYVTSLGASQRLPSLTDQELIALDDCLVTVTQSLGKCEALLRTPIPLGYTRYSVRFLCLCHRLIVHCILVTTCFLEQQRDEVA